MRTKNSSQKVYCLGVDAVCEVSIRCNILFTNHVSRMKERDIIQKIIETSQTASTLRQYNCDTLHGIAIQSHQLTVNLITLSNQWGIDEAVAY